MITNRYCHGIFLSLSGFFLWSKLQLLWHILILALSESWTQYSNLILD